MYTLITILIIIICVLLILIVLIQNPKGGGLSATFGGFSDQLLGVQRTTDFLERSTWTMAVILLGLSLLTGFFIDKGTVQQKQEPKSELEEQIESTPLPYTLPQNNATIPPEEEKGQSTEKNQ